jgi:hypothetical protein
MGSMRPPDPSHEPSRTDEVPQAVTEAIDVLARLRARGRTQEFVVPAGRTGPSRTTAPTVESGPAGSDRPPDPAADVARSTDLRRDAGAAEAAARASLRQAVERYARDLRRQGVPPERMIIAVKEVVKRATASPQPPPEPEYLIPDLVQWSIAAYFSAD